MTDITPTYKVYVSNIGPRGRDGKAEEEMTYSKRVDFEGDDRIYRGEAEVGTINSADTWRIRRITISESGDITEEWANGSANFEHVWDDRLSYSYL